MQVCHICSNELSENLSDIVDAETNEKFAVLNCEKCGLGHTLPIPANLSDYYTNYYGERHGATANFRAWRRFKLLESSFEKPLNSKRILDIGCGDGAFLEQAKMHGWQTIGTELNENLETELEVYSNLSEVKEKYGVRSFDAITLWHVLEHFENPKEVLDEASLLLKDQGRMLIAVPDAKGLQARFFGNKWLHLDTPRHLYHFSFFALEKILEETGFKILQSHHQEFEYDLLGWSQSALNKVFHTPNIFFKTLSKKEVGVGKAIEVSNFILGTLFSAIALPLVLLGTLQKKGGTIVVRVSKK